MISERSQNVSTETLPSRVDPHKGDQPESYPSMETPFFYGTGQADYPYQQEVEVIEVHFSHLLSERTYWGGKLGV